MLSSSSMIYQGRCFISYGNVASTSGISREVSCVRIGWILTRKISPGNFHVQIYTTWVFFCEDFLLEVDEDNILEPHIYT
ncbi:hypothetical protein PM082_020392 [Marasmius tenuissimus]|nr:hypothetical protein PM082_020392 [Marasmius tenuissimus]